MWFANLQHWLRKGHLPEWYGLGGLAACLRCTKGGYRPKTFRLVTMPKPF